MLLVRLGVECLQDSLLAYAVDGNKDSMLIRLPIPMYPKPRISPVESCCNVSSVEWDIWNFSFQGRWIPAFGHRIDQALANTYFSSSEQAVDDTTRCRFLYLATMLYRRGLLAQPSCTTCKGNLGTCLLKSEDDLAAVSYLKQALADDSEPTSALQNLGVAYLRLRRFSEALHVFESIWTPSIDKPSSLYTDAKFNELITLLQSGEVHFRCRYTVELYDYLRQHLENVEMEFDLTQYKRTVWAEDRGHGARILRRQNRETGDS